MKRQALSPARIMAAAVFVATVLLAGTSLATAQTETIVHAFGGVGDPMGGLVADRKGALYGTLYSGGEFGQGSVYEMVSPASEGGDWTVTTLYSFSKTKRSDGGHPSGSLLLNLKNHKIYGTTRDGGSSGFGVVYELDPPALPGSAWTETVLYNFTGGQDGSNPVDGVVFDSKGTLYGATVGGGQSCCGVVFRLSPPSQPGAAWTQRVLHSFKGGTDGSIPLGGVILDGAGALYGTAWSDGQGGGHCCGIVFQLTPPSSGDGPWKENVLHRFTSGAAAPSTSLIFDSAGSLYGTTAGYGLSDHGTVFQLTPPLGGTGAWSAATLYTFTGGSDGAQPEASLIFDNTGALYGTTYRGGSSAAGTVFKLSPPSTQGGAWTQQVLHSFDYPNVPTDGAFPHAPLVQLGNTFYGTTFYGGAAVNAAGTAFAITP
jgi:uncharacterized repeat protein (TIGR03803 family)